MVDLWSSWNYLTDYVGRLWCQFMDFVSLWVRDDFVSRPRESLILMRFAMEYTTPIPHRVISDPYRYVQHPVIVRHSLDLYIHLGPHVDDGRPVHWLIKIFRYLPSITSVYLWSVRSVVPPGMNRLRENIMPRDSSDDSVTSIDDSLDDQH